MLDTKKVNPDISAGYIIDKYQINGYFGKLDKMHMDLTLNPFSTLKINRLAIFINFKAFNEANSRNHSLDAEELLGLIYSIFFILYQTRPYVAVSNIMVDKRSMNNLAIKNFVENFVLEYAITNQSDIFKFLLSIDHASLCIKEMEIDELKGNFFSLNIPASTFYGIKEIFNFLCEELVLDDFNIRLNIHI